MHIEPPHIPAEVVEPLAEVRDTQEEREQRVRRAIEANAFDYEVPNPNIPPSYLTDAPIFRDGNNFWDAASIESLPGVKFYYQPQLLNAKNLENFTALHCAAFYFKSDISVVKYLLFNGAHVDPQDSVGATPLFHAAYKGHLPVLKSLLAHKANVNALNYEHESAVFWAVDGDQLEAVKLLVMWYANIAQVNIHNQSLLDRVREHIVNSEQGWAIEKFLMDFIANPINYQQQIQTTIVYYQ